MAIILLLMVVLRARVMVLVIMLIMLFLVVDKDEREDKTITPNLGVVTIDFLSEISASQDFSNVAEVIIQDLGW